MSFIPFKLMPIDYFFKWLVKDLYSSYEVPFHVKMAVLDWFSGRIKLVLVHVY